MVGRFTVDMVVRINSIYPKDKYITKNKARSLQFNIKIMLFQRKSFFSHSAGILLAISLAEETLSLSLRSNSHNLFFDGYNSSPNMAVSSSFSFGSFLTMIFLLAALVGGIYCYCKYCRNERESERAQVHHNGGYQMSPNPQYNVSPANPNQYPYNNNYNRQHEDNQYQAYKPPTNQYVPVLSQPPPPRNANVMESNPYQTNNGSKYEASKWVIGSKSAVDILTRQKIGNSHCKICMNDYSGIANVMVECSEDHCFHLKCLGEYRRYRNVEMDGNGFDQCPSCREKYPSVVKFFCPGCREKYLNINLVEHTGRDFSIRGDQIIQKLGGSSCESCSRR